MQNDMEEYLTTRELCSRIKYSRQSIYNMIHSGALVLGIHYVKPSRKKLLFKWSAMKAWLGEAPEPAAQSSFEGLPEWGGLNSLVPIAKKPRSRICI
jgi:excisionase family DNA binding protein